MKALILSLLLISALAAAIEKPAIEWVYAYYPSSGDTRFFDVIETSDGNLLVAGMRKFGTQRRCLFKFDQDGYLLWDISLDCDIQIFYKSVELSNGNTVSAGTVRTDPDSTLAFAVLSVAPDGEVNWLRCIDIPESDEYAYDIAALPDGGFAVCGETEPLQGQDAAWVIRFDAQGDTLWTREWGPEDQNNKAVAILYLDEGLTIFMYGNSSVSPNRAALARYDLDGNILWERGYPDWPSSRSPDPSAMCEASDDGLLLMTGYKPLVVHTDYEGNPDGFYQAPQGWAQDIGYSIDTTMDGGFIVGVDAGNEPGAVDGMCGVVSRHSVTGEMEWWDYVYEESCFAIHCVRQLSEGGYIVAGKSIVYSPYAGFLMKYAPETGISSHDPASTLSLEVSPNPCASVLSVGFALPEAGYASIQIFDLSGRLVSSVAEGDFPAGNCSVEWVAPEELSSGCYLVRLSASNNTVTENFVLFH